MSRSPLQGAITAREEFLYPDTPLGALPEQLALDMPLNGRPGIGLLLRADADRAELSLEGEGFRAEWFRMRAVPVEYNTGDGTEQGGAMVLEQPADGKPEYATRRAPFRVYDCLEPVDSGRIEAEGERIACYFCLVPDGELSPGEHRLTLRVRCGEARYACALLVRAHNVRIPTGDFDVTNWFSLDAIRRFHHLQDGTPEYYAMVRKYARAMRRLRQTMFYIGLDERCTLSRSPYHFGFEHLRPLIECFFDEGMRWLEIGPLLSRGFLPNGMPDMYTDDFKCAAAPEVSVDSPEGYALTTRFVAALADFLRANGWADRVVFHIHDEPDVHCKDERTLEARRRQYLLAASILRRHLPGVRVIEAVESPAFRGGVDIWVPNTASYEKHQAEFGEMITLGETVWSYVCCSPEGHWLNRFLDMALLKGRLLFWGCAANRLRGFLHWGFNQFQLGMDPFEGTSCPNDTGIGTSFPCGDAFLAYPGTDGPWLGMRLEAARRGAEDVALLALLRQRDEVAHDRLVARVFTNNHTYNDNPTTFDSVYAELLSLLAEE